MKTVTVHAARTTLSQLVARAEAGEEIILARGKIPVAKIVPYCPRERKREFGPLRSRLSVGPELFDPLPHDELVDWEREFWTFCPHKPLSPGEVGDYRTHPRRSEGRTEARREIQARGELS